LFGPARDPNTPFFTPSSAYPAYFGPKRSNHEGLARENQRYADIAASIQAVTEEVLVNIANQLHRETGLRRLCMAGGVALNSVANGRIFRETPFEELSFHPPPGAPGAALAPPPAGTTWSSARPGR